MLVTQSHVGKVAIQAAVIRWLFNNPESVKFLQVSKAEIPILLATWDKLRYVSLLLFKNNKKKSFMYLKNKQEKD